jgi:hypothetical protein
MQELIVLYATHSGSNDEIDYFYKHSIPSGLYNTNMIFTLDQNYFSKVFSF